jgi:RNA polymerase sigma factor for flagellar operon FliA
MARRRRKVEAFEPHEKLTEEQVQSLWASYRQKPDDQLRNRLAENYLHLVKFASERLHAKLPDEVDINDLYQDGFQGLLDAIAAYDMDRGVKFETFCTARVRGAILDSLRERDWVPRLVRARAHKLAEARSVLRLELSRDPTDKELAEHMGLGKEDYERLVRDANATGVVSLNRKCYETDTMKDVCEVDIVEDKRVDDPTAAAQRDDLKRLITKGLSTNERLIILLYYYQEMTMKEIGAALELSESRVSQMHSAIMGRLRLLLEDRQKEFAV